MYENVKFYIMILVVLGPWPWWSARD